ncbi:MAG TPA: RDD family protein [Streptosporangiaceae bacterium]|nr:RDD family protein [Streptosporangiaceae bacterium]
MAYSGTPSYSAVPSSQYSSWIMRVGAYLVDTVPIWAALIVVYIIEAIIGSTIVDILLGLILFVAILGYTVYNRWILGGQGQTIGKKMLGIKLVSEETGQPIGSMNAFIRDICHIVDSIICYIGFLFPLWDAKRQTIADKIMKTVVTPA